MFWTRVIVGLAEFVLSIAFAVLIVFWSYKSFVKFTSAYDAEEEIRRGNVAVAVLMAALMLGSALIMQEVLYPVVSIILLAMTEQGSGGYGVPTLAGYAVGQVFFGFLLSVGCVELALRFFEFLDRDLKSDQEIRRGNVAVAVIMAAVIVIIAMFMQQGVGALSKSLIPQPKLGTLSPGS